VRSVSLESTEATPPSDQYSASVQAVYCSRAMDLPSLLDEFFDHAPCCATEGYEQYIQLKD